MKYEKGSFSPRSTIGRLYTREKGKCFYCKKDVPITEGTRDHLIPQTFGGSSFLENLVYSCRSCNSKKGVKTMDTFVKHLAANEAVRDTGAIVSVTNKGLTISFNTRDPEKIADIFNRVFGKII
jgi:hypothetical protein